MRIGAVDLAKEVLVVAEIGNNHEGSYTLAEEMIGRAAEAGAGAVKFQTFRAEHYVSPADAARFSQLKSFELTYDEFARLAKVARDEKIMFLSTPFDPESAAFLHQLVPAFKIASGDNNFYPLLETVAQLGKPILLSTGLADLAQVRYSKGFIEHIWRELHIEQDLAVLHCVTSYPVPPGEVNLGAVLQLRQELQCTVGYSDHTAGIEAAALSVALGARVVEKHFTIDKQLSAFRDHQLSADPREMAELVRRIQMVLEMTGTGEKVLQSSERANLGVVRRSIVARRDLPQGATLGWGDITWTRPGGGLSPGKEHLVLGRTLAVPIRQGAPITPDLLEEEAR